MKVFEVPLFITSLFGLGLLSGLDTQSVQADFILGEPELVGLAINSSDDDAPGGMPADGLSFYYGSNRPGSIGGGDIWVATRPSTSTPWATPVNLGSAVNTESSEDVPSVTADGMSLFFHSNRAGGYGKHDIWMSKRETTGDLWGKAENVGPLINSAHEEWSLCVSSDGLEFYFGSDRPGGYGDGDVWVATRVTTDDNWSAPANLGPAVNSPAFDALPGISPDGLKLFVTSTRPGGLGGRDVWMTTRPTKNDPWKTVVNLGAPINSSNWDQQVMLSPVDSTFYFVSTRPGGYGCGDIYEVSYTLIVDFNGDGKVDGKDLLCMAAQWGTDDPLCDIGPSAWGDGIVDLQDVVALAEYIGHEVTDPNLVAHWQLDETEGSIAHESVSGNADLIMGDALWQPTGGVVGGALELDGVDDCIITGFGLNLADGPFSIFAWVNGGGPGQVVISEPMGTNWLVADVEGKLITELKSAGRDSTALLSQTAITDGTWHRIGFVWDGSQRMLFVDGVKVAEDTQDGLETFDAGLYIGVGSDYAPSSLFSGLIDDVRIYNRIVHP